MHAGHFVSDALDVQQQCVSVVEHYFPPRGGGGDQQARHCNKPSKRGGKSPPALLRRALLATTCIKLGHSYTSSNSRTVLSALPDATTRPSGLKHTDFT